jgi:hypothetical protein
MRQISILQALGMLSATAVASPGAATTTENEVLAIDSEKFSLTQSISAAEHLAGGKPARAEFELHGSTPE